MRNGFSTQQELFLVLIFQCSLAGVFFRHPVSFMFSGLAQFFSPSSRQLFAGEAKKMYCSLYGTLGMSCGLGGGFWYAKVALGSSLWYLPYHLHG